MAYRKLLEKSITDEQENYMRENIDLKTDKQLADYLGITIYKVRLNLAFLEIYRKPKARRGDAKVIEGCFDQNEFFRYYNF